MNEVLAPRKLDVLLWFALLNLFVRSIYALCSLVSEEARNIIYIYIYLAFVELNLSDLSETLIFRVPFGRVGGKFLPRRLAINAILRLRSNKMRNTL